MMIRQRQEEFGSISAVGKIHDMMSARLNLIFLSCLATLLTSCVAQNILGCGGFLKSYVDIDFTKVYIKLYTKTGSLKDQTECAPNNGYYFLPLYDKGEYILKLDSPRGWSFDPTEVVLNIDGVTDDCSQGKDIHFIFNGFGIIGYVFSLGTDFGPKGITISLYMDSNKQVPIKSTVTTDGGIFYFTPIQPGKYVLVASHPKWVISKNVVEVTMQEGNIEIRNGSLVVSGYDVNGKVTNENEPVAGVFFILFGKGFANNCDTTPVSKDFESKKPLCHTISDSDGRFVFPSLSPGEYKLIPYYVDTQTKFNIQPQELSFKVGHDSMILAQDFKVTGFTVGGLVRSFTNGSPLPGAKIFLSQKEVAITDKNGKYVLDNMKTGQYTLRAESANVQFSEKTVRISPSSPELPVLVPSAYKVSGKVILSANETLPFRKLSIKNTAATFYKELDTKKKTGEFSVYLAPDKYQLSVIVSTKEKTKGLQFFPLQQTIAVTSQPITNINFLQLKATLTGTVHCLQGTNCNQASVTLKILDGMTIKTVQAKKGKYQFKGVLPGHYEVLIDDDVFCWENPSYRISITSERAEVPPFKQNGFCITFISSHDTTVEYSEPKNKKLIILSLNKGSSTHCVPKSGTYTFVPKSCHMYDKPSYTSDTNNLSPILLHSIHHMHRGSIVTSSAQNSLKIKIEDANSGIIGIESLKPVMTDGMYKYEFEFKAKADNMYTITPLSDILLFNPPSLKVVGMNDCHNDIASFVGNLGKIIAGEIIPPLEGVLIQIFGKDKELPIHTLLTNKNGIYRVGPLDGKIEYSVIAKKEGFMITETDKKGVFWMHKLAEIIVEVFERAENSSLQSVLLSLSGGQSYRRNSITGESGKLVFNSLFPGEYYLRPMMKEYRFDPPSKIINVEEGETMIVRLFGNRVAYSAYGSVTSLNGKPEVGLLVEVQGQGNCSNLQEEATTEENGNFRIRGLQSTCTYIFRLKSNAEVNAHIQRTSPSSQLVQPVKDVHNLRLIAFYPMSRTDVAVHVTSVQPEYYRTIKVKLCADDMPDSPVHISKLNVQQTGKIASSHNPGFLVYFPPLETNGRKYFVQLESSLSQSMHKYNTAPVYFEANSSFKYVKLTFHAERKVDQADMNQTSVVALPFIVLVALAFFNREALWTWLNALIDKRSKPAPSSRAPVQTIPLDSRMDDIIVEQIMNINKRKTKPRKA